MFKFPSDPDNGLKLHPDTLACPECGILFIKKTLWLRETHVDYDKTVIVCPVCKHIEEVDK
jgi:hypothetical protein